MKALLNREMQVMKTVFGSKFDLQALTIVLFPIIFCLIFKMISLYFLIFTAYTFLNVMNLVEEFKNRKGILSMACTRKEYVKFRFLFSSTSTLIMFIVSAILGTMFSKIARRPYVSLEYMVIVFFIILFILTINLTIFFSAKESIFGIALMINIGLIIVINMFSVLGNKLLEKLPWMNFNLIDNWMGVLIILVSSIVFIFVAMFISIYFFEKKDL